MKINDLSSVLRSSRGDIQFAVLWSMSECKDIAKGSVGYIVKEYGERTVTRISAYENDIVITTD